MTKVVHLQYRLSSSGDFARRFHHEFEKVGINSSVLSLISNEVVEDKTHTLDRQARLKAKANNQLQTWICRRMKKNYGLFSYPVLGSDVSRLEEVQSADVIFIHWVLHGFLNFKSLEQLARLGKPMVIVLHDMWFITGGCHYSFDCEKYKTGCHNCPMFEGEKKKDLSYAGYLKKLKFYAKYDHIYFVSPSKWLARCARDSGLTKGKTVYHIPNVLDRQVFKAFDKPTAKEVLNLDKKKTVIAFGAVSINSPFKGWSYLQSALQLLKERSDRDYTVLLFGDADQAAITRAIPFETKVMGRVRDEWTMVMVYNAADVFIAPSLADNLPYTIFESLACGTPVVAFKTGGIPDMVQHRKNGYLAKYKDAEDLVNGIGYCLDHQIKGKLAPRFNTGLNMQKYLALIGQMLNQEVSLPKKAYVSSFFPSWNQKYAK